MKARKALNVGQMSAEAERADAVALADFISTGRSFEVVPLPNIGLRYYAETWSNACLPPAIRQLNTEAQLEWVAREGIKQTNAQLRSQGYEVLFATHHSDADLDIELGVTLHILKP